MGQWSEHQNRITETVANTEILFFSDASINGACTVAYAVIYHPNKIGQGLITIKSRLAKRNLTIPRLELIAAQMSANLSQNTKNDLNNQIVTNFYARSVSTVVLHWLKDMIEYKLFVSDRVAEIREHSYFEWNYVPTRKQPSRFRQSRL